MFLFAAALVIRLLNSFAQSVNSATGCTHASNCTQSVECVLPVNFSQMPAGSRSLRASGQGVAQRHVIITDNKQANRRRACTYTEQAPNLMFMLQLIVITFKLCRRVLRNACCRFHLYCWGNHACNWRGSDVHVD